MNTPKFTSSFFEIYHRPRQVDTDSIKEMLSKSELIRNGKWIFGQAICRQFEGSVNIYVIDDQENLFVYYGKIENKAIQIKQAIKNARQIEHCGDYGILYINPVINQAVLTLGDADTFDEEKLKNLLQFCGGSVEIADEWAPKPEDGFFKVGKIGKEVAL